MIHTIFIWGTPESGLDGVTRRASLYCVQFVDSISYHISRYNIFTWFYTTCDIIVFIIDVTDKQRKNPITLIYLEIIRNYLYINQSTDCLCGLPSARCTILRHRRNDTIVHVCILLLYEMYKHFIYEIIINNCVDRNHY